MSTSYAKTRKLAQLALFIAIQAVLTFTPLGFIQIPGGMVSFTIMHIPVVIAAVLMGPMYGSILGLSFGVFSMLKATFSPVAVTDMLFSPFSSGDPIGSLVMCVLPRILLGLVAGWLYVLLSRHMKNRAVAIGISAGVATLLHSVLVLSGMAVFFSALSMKEVFAVIIGVGALIELAAAVVVSIGVCIPLQRYLSVQRS